MTKIVPLLVDMESPNSTLTPSIDKENELRIFASFIQGGGEPWNIPPPPKSEWAGLTYGYLEKYN